MTNPHPPHSTVLLPAEKLLLFFIFYIIFHHVCLTVSQSVRRIRQKLLSCFSQRESVCHRPRMNPGNFGMETNNWVSVFLFVLSSNVPEPSSRKEISWYWYAGIFGTFKVYSFHKSFIISRQERKNKRKKPQEDTNRKVEVLGNKCRTDQETPEVNNRQSLWFLPSISNQIMSSFNGFSVCQLPVCNQPSLAVCGWHCWDRGKMRS